MSRSVEEQHRNYVHRFFRATEAWNAACGGRSFSYFGYEDSNGVIRLCAGLVLIAHGEAVATETAFGPKYVAGRVQLPKGRDAERFVESLLTGGIAPLSGRRFSLHTEPDCGISVAPPNFYHQDAALPSMRLCVLNAVAGRLPYASAQAELTWALRGGTQPFESLSELLRELGLQPPGERSSFQVAAVPPIQVWTDSTVGDARAVLGIWLPSPLEKERAALTYRLVAQGRVSVRGAVRGQEMTWKMHKGVPVGTVTIDVPVGAVVQCFATYDGEAYHSFWVADPKHFSNPRLAALEVVDPGRLVFRGCLAPAQIKNQAAPNFEAAVSWLIWAYGFAPISLGVVASMKEGPDILAVSPQGHFVVVECTLGLLKADNKLAQLVRRTVAVREKLQAIGIQNALVIPLIVTALAREHVAAELAAAAETGVVVATRENLEAALNEVVAFPDGDAAFQRLAGAAEALKVASKSHKTHSNDERLR